MEEHARGCNGQLGNLEENASLEDEVAALRPQAALHFWGHAMNNGWGACNLRVREDPLA